MAMCCKSNISLFDFCCFSSASSWLSSLHTFLNCSAKFFFNPCVTLIHLAAYNSASVELFVDVCNPNPCVNNGVCKVVNDVYACDCQAPYVYGKQCNYDNTSDPHQGTIRLVFRWDQTAQFWSQSRVQINQSPRRSLHNVIADVIADISVFLCLFMN